MCSKYQYRPLKSRLVMADALSCARFRLEPVCMYVADNNKLGPYFDPTYTRTGWIGQPPVLDRHEVVTIDSDVDTKSVP